MQSDWEKVQKTGNLRLIKVNEDNWFELQDEYLTKSGQKSQILARKKKMLKYYVELCKVLQDDTQPKMYLKMAKQDLLKNENDKLSDKDSMNLHQAMSKYMGFNIDKKTTSVENYLSYYIGYSEWVKDQNKMSKDV